MSPATGVDLAFWWVGIGLIGMLLLMGAVAWLRDWREERAGHTHHRPAGYRRAQVIAFRYGYGDAAAR